MADIVHRLLVVVWFVSYMAAIYLGLHVIMARLIRTPDSRLLWFFSVLTGPLTRPVRAALPPGTPEGRVRLVALLALIAVWIASRLVLSRLGGVDLG